MAAIVYTERSTQNGEIFDGVEAVYDGRTHIIKIYPGDTRPHGTKILAIKDCLALRIIEEAIRLGRPVPDTAAP